VTSGAAADGEKAKNRLCGQQKTSFRPAAGRKDICRAAKEKSGGSARHMPYTPARFFF